MPSYLRSAACLMLLAAGLALPSPAEAEENSLPADGAALDACLGLVKRNAEEHPAQGTPEKTGPEGRLAAARDSAAGQAESCIGAISTACLQDEANQSTAAMILCYGRESAAWDARLNEAYKKALKSAEDADVIEGFRKTQRAWITLRDAACAQPRLVFKGTMAGPLEAECVMSMTARQAIWLEDWPQ